jgi:hypothetical protein
MGGFDFALNQSWPRFRRRIIQTVSGSQAVAETNNRFGVSRAHWRHRETRHDHEKQDRSKV